MSKGKSHWKKLIISDAFPLHVNLESYEINIGEVDNDKVAELRVS